jgi:D-glycero-D-manno-heptose 1,7-bisphosphate phosphatase
MGVSTVTQNAHRAVFCDRDGVLNRAIMKAGKPYPPTSLAELQIMPDALPTLTILKNAGFLLLGVTNQPDVARGTQSREVVEAINSTLLRTLPLSEILVCYHDDGDGCVCRKPQPGLLLQAAAHYGIRLSDSFLIGDRWRDVEAGQRAGCKTVLLDYGYSERKSEQPADCIVASLADAVTWIMQSMRKGGGE